MQPDETSNQSRNGYRPGDQGIDFVRLREEPCSPPKHQTNPETVTDPATKELTSRHWNAGCKPWPILKVSPERSGLASLGARQKHSTAPLPTGYRTKPEPSAAWPTGLPCTSREGPSGILRA